jgi:hypothetical protein
MIFDFECDLCGNCFNLVDGQLVGFVSKNVYSFLCDDGYPHRFRNKPLELGNTQALVADELVRLEVELR